MSFFDLIARLFEYLVVWVPRPLLVPPIQSCVRWTLGNEPVRLYGLSWWMPLIHQIEHIDLRVDATEFEPKVLWTRDGKEAAIGMVIVWRVADPVLCARTVNGLGELVSRLGESVLPELVGRFSLEELKSKAAGGAGREWAFDTHLRKSLGECFAPYGIAIESARVNFTSERVRCFKIIGASNETSHISFSNSAL